MSIFRRFFHLDRDFKILFTVLILITAGSLWYAYQCTTARVTTVEKPDAAAEEMQKIVAELGTVMVLPDETPTLATVSNPEALKGQSFFAKALEGDKVLIYSSARKAILWRPSTHKIIEVSELETSAPPGR